MIGIWKGVDVSFLLQLAAAIGTFAVTESPKFTLAAMAVVAGFSGLILWGHIVSDEVGRALTMVTALVLCGVLVFVIESPLHADDLWRTFRSTVIALVFLSWLAPALWLWGEEKGYASSWDLIWSAAPFGVGAVLCAVLYRPRYLRRILGEQSYQ